MNFFGRVFRERSIMGNLRRSCGFLFVLFVLCFLLNSVVSGGVPWDDPRTQNKIRSICYVDSVMMSLNTDFLPEPDPTPQHGLPGDIGQMGTQPEAFTTQGTAERTEKDWSVFPIWVSFLVLLLQ